MKTVFAAVALGWVYSGLAGTVLIDADDERIAFEGRYADIDGGRAFDWGRARISFATDAREVALLLDDGKADYGLEVNGDWKQRLVTAPGRSEFPVALGEGVHHVVLTRLNDPRYGEAVFKGLKLVEGRLLAPPPVFERKLEWIGASFMTGYGVEGPGTTCSELRSYENAMKAYPALVSSRLKARMHLTAISGKGVVKEWGYPGTASPDALPALYDRGSSAREYPRWDHARFRADAVVISLGGNDFGTEPHPDGPDWLAGYERLLRHVRKAHGQDVPILVIYDDEYEELTGLTRQIVETQQLDSLQLDRPADEEFGCDRHPKVEPQQRWAKRIEEKLRAMLDWPPL